MYNSFFDLDKTNAIIDLDAIAHNYNYTKERTQNRVICVIKANAYGHGACEVAKRLEKEGADFFAVATIDEAIELRNSKISSDILILGYIFPKYIKTAINYDISLAAPSLHFIEEVAKQAEGKTAKLHIKLNTGMNRTGFYLCDGNIPEDFEKAVSIIKENKNLHIEGLFTHFAKAESDREFTLKQFSNFKKGKDYLSFHGIPTGICHVCNSAALENYPQMHLDAVRLGIAMYGEETNDKNYLPSMSFNTRIVEIRELKANDGVSYGLDFVAEKPMRIAVIGAGYADGVRRSLSGKHTHFLCRGKRAELIGRVCMDMSMIDISCIPEAAVGDIVTMWGKNENSFISCSEQAEKAGTISYELLCGVSERVPRIYVENKI